METKAGLESALPAKTEEYFVELSTVPRERSRF
jgi:hypothetical protein